MNVLFVSVKERTNEIGILKAIGCFKRDILVEFLMEASCTSMVGAVLSLVFGVLTGTLFGFYPAYQASNLIPVVALNHE